MSPGGERVSKVTDYKILTLADKSVIRLALIMRKAQIEQMLVDLKKMKDAAYDRTMTQLKQELEQIKAALPKVSL